MNPERLNHDEIIDRQKEGLINLDSLSFDFCDEDIANNFYEEKLRLLNDKERWIEENKNKIEESKEKVAKAVEDGLIADTKPETIWKFQVDKTEKEKERVVGIKNELESSAEEIKFEVAKKLSKFLPDWSPSQVKIVFTMNENADFCIDENIITVDLGRLASEENPIEKTKEGVAHEVFHFWMGEKSQWWDSEQDSASDDELRDRIIFKTIDEGIAVLIGGQSLEDHHTRRGRDFTEYKNESLDLFKSFLKEKKRRALENIKDNEFRDMGHFYVAGNEIVKTVLQNDGMEKFKEHIIEARDNPEIFLERYREICSDSE